MDALNILPPLLGGLIGLAAVGGGVWLAARTTRRAREDAARSLDEAEREGEERSREALVAAQEKALVVQEESERREREIEESDAALEQRERSLGRAVQRLLGPGVGLLAAELLAKPEQRRSVLAGELHRVQRVVDQPVLRALGLV